MLKSPNRRYLVLILLAALPAILPGSEGWSGPLARGHDLAIQHRLLDAMGQYRSLSRFPGREPQAAALEGRLYLRRGQWGEAAERFQSAATAAESREAMMGAAAALDRLGDGQGSLAYLRRELELRPWDSEAWTRLVEGAARLGARPGEILRLLGGVDPPTGDPINGQRAAFLLATCLEDPASMVGRLALQKAAEGPDPTLRQDSRDILHLLELASRGEGKASDLPSALMAGGLIGPALELLEGAWGAGGPEAEVLALRGYGLMRTGRSDEAAALLERGYALDSENPLVQFLFGSYLRERGDEERAARMLYSASLRDPENPAIYAELANGLISLGDYGTGEQALRAAVQAAPGSPELRLAVAEFYSDRQLRLETALEDAREAVRLSNRDAGALGALGWVLHLSQRTEEALPLLEEAVGKNPEDPLLRYRLGSVLDQMKLTGRAREQYLMVEQLDGSGDYWSRARVALEEMR